MERTPQTLANHAKYDPAFHFFLSPLALVLFIGAVRHALNAGTGEAWGLAGLALTLLVAVFKMRLYSLKVQDRLIRLEERLRLAKLAPDMEARAGDLAVGQWVALRFASDAEMPALAAKAISEKLTGRQIKEHIREWRADLFRV
jgi:hypothetical protein